MNIIYRSRYLRDEYLIITMDHHSKFGPIIKIKVADNSTEFANPCSSKPVLFVSFVSQGGVNVYLKINQILK
jgi:hypothetical protein